MNNLGSRKAPHFIFAESGCNHFVLTFTSARVALFFSMERVMANLAMKEKKMLGGATEADPKKGRGRPASPRVLMFQWYGGVEGFQHTSWWKSIDWDEEAKGSRTTRSRSPRQRFPRDSHPGFLWESIRRMPELQELLELFNGLERKELLERSLSSVEFGLFLDATRNSVEFIRSTNSSVFEALQILASNWKLSFDRLEQDAKQSWKAVYLDLWAWVGESGSVPTAPVQPIPDLDEDFNGVGRTAFDLLIQKGGMGPASGHFEQRPLPGLLLDAFTCVHPPSPVPNFREEVDPAKKFPWVSFGILGDHLDRHGLKPLLFAVDLTRSTDSILRDLKQIIDEKRREWRLVETDRRIKQESFGKIEELDRQVFSESSPLKRSIKEFEAAAQLDLGRLIRLASPIETQSPLEIAPSSDEILAILQEQKLDKRDRN